MTRFANVPNKPESTSRSAAGLRVLAVDDDAFTSAMIASSLRGAGYATTAANTVREALDALEKHDFHAVVTDLNLGPGPSGADLLWKIQEETPWIGMVVLTSHVEPELAIGPNAVLPPDTAYLVKSELANVQVLSAAIAHAVRGGSPIPGPDFSRPRAAITSAQAEVLRLLSAGASTSIIAASRGTSIRATEMMMHRLYEKLGLHPYSDRDPRTDAVLMWLQGQVRIQ